MIVELRSYHVEILALEAGNTEMTHDDLRASKDHTSLKIELKDMLDNFRDILHLKKKDFEDIFAIGIQVNRT